MSHAKLSTALLNSTVKTLLKRGSQVGFGLSAFSPVLALANPTGGTVIAGSATITNPNANGTVVKETSAAAIIDWQQFNIGKGQYVQFLQPSSSSIILNRVIGGAGSSIYGSLTGNGQIFLVNTNGVFFGKGSSIDAQGFLASTLDISDTDFLARNFVFDKSGSDASVINQGSITAHKGGYVVLAGDYTENDGVIAAQSGHIILASGTKSTLTLNGNSLVSYAVDQATLAQLAGVANAGKLEADGGTVIMTADVANLLKATVVNNTGLIEATSLSNQNGVIQLLATGGNIQNAGTLDVDATQAGQQGGSITLKGDAKTLLTDTSKITATGDGADGGRVEVSGDTLSMRGALTLGKGGRLLLDPGSVQLVSNSANSNLNSPGLASNNSSVGHAGVNFIEKQLNNGVGVTIEATNKIDASANVHAIDATGTGALSMTVPTGQIALSGVDINIGGRLSASMHSGTFGHLTAGSIALHANGSGAKIVLPKATVTNGAVTTWSAKTTTGDLNIAGGSLQMQDSSANATLALDAAQEVVLAATYGDNSHERQGNLTVAGARMQALTSVHVTGNISAIASNGYAEFGNVIAGGNVGIAATGGVLGVHNVTAGGTTGITLTDNESMLSAANLVASHGNVSLTDTDSIDEVRAFSINAAGTVSVNAGAGGQIQFGSPAVGGATTVVAGKGITLTAKGITFSGTNNAVFKLETSTGNITVHGAIGSSQGSEHIGKGGVTMSASNGAVTLDHKIDVFGNVVIKAKSLNYTGAGNLEIDAIAGGIGLDASIGTAKAPVAYGVTLDDSSGPVVLNRSIYTKGSIDVTEIHQNINGSAGVFVGDSNSTPITLSAKGPIKLQGAQVAIGYTGVGNTSGTMHHRFLRSGNAAIVISADDGNSKTSTDKLTIDASGSSVTVMPDREYISSGSPTKTIVDYSITLHAGADVDINAARGVNLRGGSISAYAFYNNAFVNATDNLNVTAGHDILVTGSFVDVRGGFARASIDPHNDSKVSDTAAADVNFTAGNDIGIIATGANTSGMGIIIAGGSAYGHAYSTLKNQKATASATATVSLTAGHNVTVDGSAAAVRVAGGDYAGTGSGASAAATGSNTLKPSNAVADVTLANNVSIQAANALSIKGTAVTLRGGSNAGGAYISHFGSSGSMRVQHPTYVYAEAKDDTAAVAIDSALNLSAGKGGMSLSGSLNINGGRNAAQALQMSDSGSGAHVSDTIDASVTLASKGNLSFKGSKLAVQGGSAARVGVDFSHGSVTGQKDTQILGRGDAVIALSVDTGVTLNAAGSITANETNNIRVDGGSHEGSGMQVNIGALGTKGTTKITLDGGVDITAGTALALTGDVVSIQGGVGAASHADIQAYGGAVTWSGDDAVALAGKSVALTSTSSHGLMRLQAGNGGQFMAVDAGNAAKATVSLDQGLTITATNGGITLKGHSLTAGGGSNGGYRASVDASNGATAALDVNGTLNFKATGGFSASFAGNNLSIHGGSNGLEAAYVSAKAGGAVASLSAEDSLSITAASAKLTGANISVTGGRGAVPLSYTFGTPSGGMLSFFGPPAVQADAAGKATATVKESGAVNLALTGALAISAPNDVVLRGANSNGYGGSAFAQGEHAVANYSVDGSLNIKAGSMQVSAGHDLTIGSQERDGLHAHAQALQGGDATDLENSSVNLTVAKALILGAGSHLVIGGDRDMGGSFASAHSSAAATLTDNDGVNLKAGNVALTAVNGVVGIALGGGSEIGDGRASAAGKSKAAYTEDAGVSITAATGFSAKLTGSDSYASIRLTGARGAGDAEAEGDTGGTAKVSVAAGLSINVTGATGSVDIDTGKTTHGTLTIQGGVDAGEEARTLGNSGAASMNVAAGVNIAAKGAVTLTDQDANALVAAGSGAGGGSRSDRAETRATGTGGKAVTSLSSAVSISGGTLSITDTNGYLAVQGGYRVSSPSFTGIAAAAYYSDEATGSKVTATATVDSSVSLTAKGNLSLIAQTVQLGVSASSADLASGAKVSGIFGGKAALTANAGVNLSGGNVSIQAPRFNADGQKDVARDAQLLGGSNGGNASLTANGGVSIKATGTFTLAGSSVEMSGGVYMASNAVTHASGSHAVTALSLQSAVAISAKTISITDTGYLGVHGGRSTGRSMDINATSGGANTATLASQVSITASGTLSTTAHGIGIEAGNGGDSSDIDADHGKAVLTLTSGVTLTAGGNLSLNAGGGSMYVYGGYVGSGQVLTAGPGGTVTDNLSAAVLIKSTGGKVSLADISDLQVYGGFDDPHGQPAVNITGTGKVSGVLDGSISVLGKSVVTSSVGSFNHGGTTVSFTDDGITGKGTITVTGGISKLSYAPLSLGTLQTDGLILNLETVLSAPAQGGQSTLFTPAASPETGATGCKATLVKQDGRCLLQY